METTTTTTTTTAKRRSFIAKAIHFPPQLFGKKRGHRVLVPHCHSAPGVELEHSTTTTTNEEGEGAAPATTVLGDSTNKTKEEGKKSATAVSPKQLEQRSSLKPPKTLLRSQSSPSEQLPSPLSPELLWSLAAVGEERRREKELLQTLAEQQQQQQSDLAAGMQKQPSSENANNNNQQAATTKTTTTRKKAAGSGRGKAVRFVADTGVLMDEAAAEHELEAEEERANESDVEDNVDELVEAGGGGEHKKQREVREGGGIGSSGQVKHSKQQQQQQKDSTSSADFMMTTIEEQEEEHQKQQQLNDQRLHEALSELERAQKSVQFLQFQIQEKEEQFNELNERMEHLQTQQQRDMERENAQLAEYERLLAAANTKIEQLLEKDHDKQETIEQLHKKLSQAFEAASVGSRAMNGMNGSTEQEQQQENNEAVADNEGLGGEQQQVAAANQNGGMPSNAHEMDSLRLEIGRLEERLQNATQEKEYYKKHFKGEQQPAHNGHSMGAANHLDDFGKELMMANKRKYQLESRVKQLEREMRELQQRATHLDESLKNTEKLLWLEKERTATLENEREQLARELNELRIEADTMRRDLEAHRGEGNHPFFSEREHQEDLSRLRAECDQRFNELREMKSKVEWRLGEVMQQFHDTKWRMGEVEATLAHRDWQLEQANNRIKELEGSLTASDPAKLSDEVNRMRQELGKVNDEKGRLEWRLGEVTQWWNDAKWRVGELEGESAHRSYLLDQAHHKIGELERKLDSYTNGFDLPKAYNDAKWRVGELEAEVGRIRYEKDQSYRELNELKDQNGKLEWKLSEMTQSCNDAKWRLGEMEERLKQGGGGEGWSNAVADKKLAEENGQLKALVQDGTFLIRKQPHADRQKWKTLTLENMQNASMRRVWFETDAGKSREVFLIGSFLNWECAVLCETVPERPHRVGIWVDMPIGRIEFRFLRDGQWHTGNEYTWTWTQHGTKNNVMIVE